MNRTCRQVGILMGCILAAQCAPPATAITADLYAVAGDANGAVIAGTDGTVRFASGGHTSFSPPFLDEVTALLRGAVHNGYANYFVVGDAGTILVSSGANGSAFLIQTSGSAHDLYGVAPFQNATIAVGDAGTILRQGTPPLGGWTSITSPTGNTLRAVVKGATTAVAVGEVGTIVWGNITGADWHLVTPHPAEGTDLLSVAVLADGRFMAVGREGIVVRGTANGLDWTLLDPPTDVTLHGVAARSTNPARIVVVGAGGAIHTSTDAGDSWADVSPGLTVALRAVVHTGTDFIVVGDHGTVLQSTEGVTWNDYTPTQRSSWGAMKRMFR